MWSSCAYFEICNLNFPQLRTCCTKKMWVKKNNISSYLNSLISFGYVIYAISSVCFTELPTSWKSSKLLLNLRPVSRCACDLAHINIYIHIRIQKYRHLHVISAIICCCCCCYCHIPLIQSPPYQYYIAYIQ